MEPMALLENAKQAMEAAYAPYSGFRVGAALLTAGCNVENESFGATICAERTAAVKAVSDGERRFVQLAIVSSSGRATPPCGMCRQVLAEFADGLRIYLAAEDGYEEYTLDALFPQAKLPMEWRN